MLRAQSFPLLLVTLCAIAFSASHAKEDRPPNVVVILVDDLGWMDLACQGSDRYRTPHIDRLAEEGMRFTDGYAACAVCSPSRAAVQTGRYPGRVGVTDWIRSLFQRGNRGTPEANPTEYVGGNKNAFLCPPNPFWMEHEEVTIAEVLGEAGYHTAYIGKWHLGDEAWFPEGQGYHENRGGCDYGQPPSYFDPFNQPKGKHETIRNGIPGLPGREPGEYLTDREADELRMLIEGWKDEPFYIQYSPYAVHTPIQAKADLIEKYKAEDNPSPAYAAMMESLDDAIGTLLATLEENGLDDDTFVLFTSDNGGLDRNGNPTENAPLRSGKGYAYEGGIRVPFIARWPGKIPAGTTSDLPVCSIDIFPTVLEIAGAEAPADHEIDGLSLLPHLLGGGEETVDRDTLIWHFPHYRHAPGPYSIVRRGDHKLIHFYAGEDELYHLGDDLGETTDLAASSPELASELRAALLEELEAMGSKMPLPNPNYVGE